MQSSAPPPEPRSAAGVSVVIPSHLGRERLPVALRSLARQTLDRSLLEVVVALNGPADGSRAVVDRFRGDHPGIALTVVELPEPGASAARNAALGEVTRAHVAFLDDDDWLSPAYLEILLRHARPGIVPVGQIVDVTPAGRANPDTAVNQQILPFTSQTVAVDAVPRALGLNACKLVPAAAAKATRYDTELRSGVDVVYFATLLAHYAFDLFICPVDSGPAFANAVYYRLLRPDSMSRREQTFEFSVVGRLEVVARLDRLLPLCDDHRGRVLMSSINAQTGFIKRYLAEHPDDRARVLATAERYALVSLPPARLDRLTR
ncbi:MAG: glycosyltransferase family 2 protein [Hamadaea sp.]|nr:glycosyltransferase family 2 protein [Hamadaea sp.]